MPSRVVRLLSDLNPGRRTDRLDARAVRNRRGWALKESGMAQVSRSKSEESVNVE